MRILLGLAALGLMGCTLQAPNQPTTQAAKPVDLSVPKAGPKVSAAQGVRNFKTVLARMEPVVEQQCRALTQGINCDFNIGVDDRPGLPPNAYQTLDRNGRPVLGFTVALLKDMRNQHEIAFVLGHEAAHHIQQHLARQKKSATAGAVIFGVLAAGLGGSSQAIDTATQIGAAVGGRSYSKNYELEADQLGAKLTKMAGYDPIRGVAYFTRIPDPGNQFLGTHPPNGARIATVKAAVR